MNVCHGGTVTLNLQYRREGLDNANDYAKVEISSTGRGGPWTELTRFAGPANDGSFQPYSVDIRTFATETTWIRLITSSNMGNNDSVWFDDVSITCSP